METILAVSFGSFLAGWFSRDWSIPKGAEPFVCRCDCASTGSVPAVSDQQSTGGGTWFLCALLIILVVAVFSNTALALRISLRDSGTGTDRELTFSVKGKSKGVYGAARPLQITG